VTDGSTSSRGFLAFASIAAAGFGVQLLTVLSGPLVARMLGPEGRGLMGLLIAIALLCSLVGVGGLPAAIAHAVAVAGAPARDVVRGNLRFWAALLLVPSVVASGIAGVLVRDEPDAWLLAALCGVLCYLLALNFLFAAMLQGEGNVRRINLQRVVGMASYVAVIAVMFMVWPTDRAGYVVGVYALSLVGGVIMCLAFLRPSTHDPSVIARRADVHAFARRGWISGLNALDGLGVDQLLVGLVLGQTALGLYAVAVSITSFPSLVLTGVAAVLLPRMAAAGARGSVGVMRSWLAAAAVLNVTMIIGIEIVVAPALRIFFGEDFVPATAVARVLAIAWGFLAMRRLLTAAAQAQGKVAKASLAEAAVTVLFVVSAVVLMHVWDLEGAAAAMLLAGVVFCVWVGSALSWRRPAGEHVDVELSDVAELDDADHRML